MLTYHEEKKAIGKLLDPILDSKILSIFLDGMKKSKEFYMTFKSGLWLMTMYQTLESLQEKDQGWCFFEQIHD